MVLFLLNTKTFMITCQDVNMPLKLEKLSFPVIMVNSLFAYKYLNKPNISDPVIAKAIAIATQKP